MENSWCVLLERLMEPCSNQREAYDQNNVQRKDAMPIILVCRLGTREMAPQGQGIENVGIS